MQFKLGFSLAVIGAMFVHAAPAGNGTEVAKRDTGHIYICTDVNFSGDCTNYGVQITQCSNFPPEFQSDISSVGPDGDLYCILYEGQNCPSSSFSYSVTAPGYSDLSSEGDGYANDRFNSVVCYYN